MNEEEAEEMLQGLLDEGEANMQNMSSDPEEKFAELLQEIRDNMSPVSTRSELNEQEKRIDRLIEQDLIALGVYSIFYRVNAPYEYSYYSFNIDGVHEDEDQVVIVLNKIEEEYGWETEEKQ